MVATLIRLHRDIRRAREHSTFITIVSVLFLLVALAVLVSLPMAAEPGNARRTVAAFVALVVVAGTAVAPVFATGPGGLLPEHVRLLPVTSAQVRSALAVIAVTGPAMVVAVLGLLTSPLAFWTDGQAVAGFVAVITILPLAVTAVIASKIVGLLLAQAMRTPAGRVVGTVIAVVAAAALYSAFTLADSLGAFVADNRILAGILRILPTGWPVVAGEAVAGLRSAWLAPIVMLGAFAVAAGSARWWSALVDRAMYDELVTSTRKTPGRTVTASGSPTSTILRAEARLMVTDPPRLTLFMMPMIFLVVGVVLMVTSADVYGMKYGAPVIVYIAGAALFNAYALDRLGFAIQLVSPFATPLILRARQIITAVVAATSGAVGVALAYFVGDVNLPVAAAVLIAGVGGMTGAAAVVPALAPYKVPTGSGMSSLSSRGSMNGANLGYTLATFAAMALLTAPGLIVALLVEGPFAYLGALISVILGVAAAIWGHRKGRTLVATRGPEIFATII